MAIHELDLWLGKKGASIATPEALDSIKIRGDLLKRVVDWQLAKRRGGNHVVKGRSDVAVSGRKIYRQKGTGGARHSSRSANLFRGGGVTFGPQKRSHEFGLPKRLRHYGLCAALADKMNAGMLFQWDANSKAPEVPRTKDIRAVMDRLNLTRLLVLAQMDNITPLRRALNNVPYCDVIPFEAANVYDIMRHHQVIVDAGLWDLLLERKARIKSRRKIDSGLTSVDAEAPDADTENGEAA